MSAITPILGQIAHATSQEAHPPRNDSGQVQGSSAANQLSTAQAAAVVTISGNVQRAPGHAEGRKADASFEKQRSTTKEASAKKTRRSVDVSA